MRIEGFDQAWLVDFEYGAAPGERPDVRCMVAREFHTGRTIRAWVDQLSETTVPPFPVDASVLFVAYYASAELGCFGRIGWPMPARVLDLFTEFRCLTNGLETVCGNGLLGALAYYGIGGIDTAEKKEMRDLALRGGEYTRAERTALLDYCETDVVALAKLLPAMLPKIDLPRALLRGRYMAAAARIEHTGTPIDMETLEALRENWTGIQSQLIQAVDQDFGVYVPTDQPLDPQTKTGAAIIDEAEAQWLDPYRLAEAVDVVWTDDRDTRADFDHATKVARAKTGLTANKIERWENSGGDSSMWKNLDVDARELAAEFPQLGIGQGYVAEDVADDTDYAGRLWELLREGTRPRLPKHDPHVLSQAVALVRSEGEGPLVGPLRFSSARFAEWLTANDIPWPRLETGLLALDDATFRTMAKRFPQVAPLRELRHAISQLRLNDLAVGADGRNRCMLSAFRARTGRNQPSNSRFIFGPSCWLRGLIKPEPGRAICYCDWSQQEFGIAAALSGDRAMAKAYTSGDPYLTFAIQAGEAPTGATKETHGAVRESFKVCALAVQYGMGEKSLAESLGKSEAFARRLLRLHRETYPKFWKWSQAATDHAMLLGRLHTVFGWMIYVGPKANPRALANFPMQGNGSEMLRLACCLATERGINVCAPIHDALLVEGPADSIEAVVADTQDAMAEASRVVLGGFELRADAKIVRCPDRYMDPRGEQMWKTVLGLLPPQGYVRDAQGTLCAAHTNSVRDGTPVHSYLSYSSSFNR